MVCLCKVCCGRKAFHTFPLNYKWLEKTLWGGAELKGIESYLYFENKSLTEPEIFQTMKEWRPHIGYFNNSLLGWTFKEQRAVYGPMRPGAIKGKFTVGKGKYVNKVYSLLQTSAFWTVTGQNIRWQNVITAKVSCRQCVALSVWQRRRWKSRFSLKSWVQRWKGKKRYFSLSLFKISTWP